MILVGLTGGIGSGKSTVCSLLVERGALLIDSDAIVREVQQPGSPVLADLAERFGAQIITADGALDRQALANLVFGDPEAVKALNKIVHPAVGVVTAKRVQAQVGTDRVVVIDIPLLTERPRDNLQGGSSSTSRWTCRSSGWCASAASTRPTRGRASPVRRRASTVGHRRLRRRQQRLAGGPGTAVRAAVDVAVGAASAAERLRLHRVAGPDDASVSRAKISSSTTSPVGDEPVRR